MEKGEVEQMKKTKMVAYIVAMIMVISLVPAPRASAYSLTGQRVNTMITFIPHNDFGTTTIAHFNQACYLWNSAIGYNLVYRDPTVRHTAYVYPSNDGRSYIYRVNIGSNDYVMQTTWYYNGNVVTSADINVNLFCPWANEQLSGFYDVWTVFLHELGHVLGLDHSSVTTAVMYKYVYTNKLNRYLTSDEISGLIKIYG